MSLAALLPQLPPARRARLQRFLDLGWPHRRLEAWHYTDLTTLGRQDWQLPRVPGDDTDIEIAAVDHFGLLNSALAEPLPADRVASGEQQHSRQQATLAPDETATQLIEQGGQVDGLRSRWQHWSLGRDSRLHLVWLSTGDGNGQDLARLSASLAADAELDLVILHLGRVNSRLEIDLRLEGPGSAVHLQVLSLPQHGAFDLPFTVHHLAPRATSRAQLRAIGLAGTRASLNGRIVVHEGAVKTDSEQRIASLLLAPGAEINAKPDLEIYNDDVKCAHGASVGQLDPQALFYLQARGIPPDEARALLIQAFADPVLAAVQDEGLRARLQRQVRARLGGDRS